MLAGREVKQLDHGDAGGAGSRAECDPAVGRMSGSKPYEGRREEQDDGRKERLQRERH